MPDDTKERAVLSLNGLIDLIGKVMEKHDIAHESLVEHLDKKFAGVHRSIHSSDKTARVLIDLVKKQTELEDGYIWKCPKCGEECLWDADNATDGGTPMCIECDIDMNADRFFLFDSEEWKAAIDLVARIDTSKKPKKEES